MPGEEAVDDELILYRLQADDVHQATLKVKYIQSHTTHGLTITMF